MAFHKFKKHPCLAFASRNKPPILEATTSYFIKSPEAKSNYPSVHKTYAAQNFVLDVYIQEQAATKEAEEAACASQKGLLKVCVDGLLEFHKLLAAPRLPRQGFRCKYGSSTWELTQFVVTLLEEGISAARPATKLGLVAIHGRPHTQKPWTGDWRYPPP
ncbi:hypothetical protein BDK51DRAFT_28249 [Blyttiomyces helicus]|uniref:Uncharacterized protein n=1 Tax=Blyttiomyces helicus TaxID=388810 RepID=A0A4V1ISB4_9FUNG|nr:hypothetical protein BDK51DRAFT_28249 [Blyttiomyces helicus]|eukprot:RKO92967.1 hypothetical protein BDK51DRAFT_28249 [Blyttiomyces helicus]